MKWKTGAWRKKKWKNKLMKSWMKKTNERKRNLKLSKKLIRRSENDERRNKWNVLEALIKFWQRSKLKEKVTTIILPLERVPLVWIDETEVQETSWKRRKSSLISKMSKTMKKWTLKVTIHHIYKSWKMILERKSFNNLLI